VPAAAAAAAAAAAGPIAVQIKAELVPSQEESHAALSDHWV